MPTESNDLIRGPFNGRTINALGGDDHIYWGPSDGSTVLYAGDRNERFDSNPYSPGNPGGDRLFLTGNQSANVWFGSTEEGFIRSGNANLKFFGVERFFGTNGNDVINGGSAIIAPAHDGTPTHGLSLYAGGGQDRIFGSRFNDIIDGGPGNDTIWAGAGDDFIHSSKGNDFIHGGDGNENIRWGSGDNSHNPGHDTISGGAGNDLINIWIKDGDINERNEAAGIRGVSVTIGTVHADGSFSGNARTDIGGLSSLRFHGFELAWTHAGNDTVSAANATVAANNAGINFNTRWGHDVMVGSRGNDTLVADEGKDTVTGGAGNDQLWIGEAEQGDGDRDVLIFHRGTGHDTVFGFDSGLDVLNLNGQSYTARETADGTLLNLGAGDTILLSDVFDFI